MVRIELVGIPPSSNNAYVDIPPLFKKGKVIPQGRRLSTEGAKYKKETTLHIVRNYPVALSEIKKDAGLMLYVRFFFENLYNKGWPKTAESRYKRTDVTNRVKLLEDCIKDACGIDDSQNEVVLLEKRQGPYATVVFIWNLEREVPPALDELTRLLLGPLQPNGAVPGVSSGRAERSPELFSGGDGCPARGRG
jgi:Holliday junction resolvase RusA-like endonuclease